MNKKIASIMLASLIGITACSRVEQGEVYDKQFVPAHTESTVLVISTVVAGHVGTTVVPGTKAVPDEWQISIRDDEGDTDTYSVSQKTYADVEIGRFYRVYKTEGEWRFDMLQRK